MLDIIYSLENVLHARMPGLFQSRTLQQEVGVCFIVLTTQLTSSVTVVLIISSPYNRMVRCGAVHTFLCLGLLGAAGTETMEVAAGIPPLDLHFRQTYIRELAKIQAKSIRQPIKILLNNMTENDHSQDISRPSTSPIRLALTYAKEMEKVIGVNIQIMEEEPEYEEGSIGMSASAPQYWSRLGSSKSRTSDQQEKGRELILGMMMEAPEGTTFAFTGGSCLTNPGPCGAGAVIYPDHQQPVCLTRPVCGRGSILLGELVAILITLEYMVQHLATMTCGILKIFSDSQSTVGILTLKWKDTSYRSITRDIRNAISILQQAGTKVDINWAPGHSSIAGNEEADRLAKEAAHEASTFPEGSKSTSMADVKLASHAHIMTLWQRRWDLTEVGRVFYKYFPSIDTREPSINHQKIHKVRNYNYRPATTPSTTTDPS